MRVLGYFAHGSHFDLGVLGHLRLKNMTRKNDKIHKDFELYQVFMCQTVLILLNIYRYIIHKKN